MMIKRIISLDHDVVMRKAYGYAGAKYMVIHTLLCILTSKSLYEFALAVYGMIPLNISSIFSFYRPLVEEIFQCVFTH